MTNPVFVGLDLGQARDHTAIAVIEREERPVAWMPPVRKELRVRYLERMKLGTPYTEVVDRVKEILAHPQLGTRKRFIVDATGVGAPVVDLLKRAKLGCSVIPVTITSGEQARCENSHWYVPKRDLMTGLLLLLEQQELKIVRGVPQEEQLLKELMDIELSHRPGGKVRMGAEGAGRHDDLVIAVALACWRARQSEIGFGNRPLLSF